MNTDCSLFGRFGLLTGSNGGSGSIVYATGALQVNFSTAPAIDAAITVEYVGGV